MASRLIVDNLRGAIVGPVSLAVAAGRCATISGPSGAGKSLLLRMIADLVPSAGEVRLDGVSRDAVPAPAWRRRVVHAAEAGWWDEAVAAHFPADGLPRAKAQAARLGLDDGYFERTVATLSNGERQRLALVRALARRPEAVLLDEPTSALDPASTERVEALLRDTLAAGTIVVLVTHDAAQGDRLGAARYAMEGGRLAPA